MRIDPEGRAGPTPGQARGPRWRRASHGLYVPAHVVRSDQQRALEAAAVLPRYGAITGWAALDWVGGRWFTGDTPGDEDPLPIDLAVCRSSDIRRQAGMRVCQEPWSPSDVVEVDGVPVTVPVRSAAFAMRYARTVWEAVEVLDMAAYDDLVSLAEMTAYAGHAPRFGLSAWTGIPQCRRAVLLADENSWSPRETWLRLVWTELAGLPRPLSNRPIFDLTERHLGTPDLVDAHLGVVGQYDSVLHLDRDARVRDVGRDDVYRAVGLECFSVVTGEPIGVVVSRILAARERAIERRAPRRWTVEPPPWWTQTTTVAQRRALSDRDRARLLRYREIDPAA